jgi:Topoisomerase IA
MKLIIAEKPELGRAIAQALQLNSQEHNGVISGRDYTVIWAYGHLMNLKQPEQYDERYANWNLQDLPIYFDRWQLVPSEGKESRLRQIKGMIAQADEIIHAGDPDDEGQFLIDEILEYSRNTKPVYRVLINDNTPSEIQKSFRQLQLNDRFTAIGKAAYARAVSDLIVGVNYSRFFGLSLNVKGLSVGRVQTPTLGLVVNRDYLIEHHVQQLYYELTATMEAVNESLQLDFKPEKELAGEEKHITDRSILERVQFSLPAVSSATVTKKQAFSKPPLPFNLVKLQAYMNEKYNMPVSRTLEVTQTLRDKYKAITYNRSDCQYLKEEHFSEAPRVIGKVLGKLQLNIPVDYRIKSDCFNDANVTAHHAIIPTDSDFGINSLEGDLRLVFMEIAKRYIIQFLPPVELTVTRIIDPVPGGTLEAESTEVINQGYSRYYKAEEKKQTALSRLVPGIYSCDLQSSEIIEKKTTPPKRYTQATLITDMTSISKYVDDPKIKQILKDKDKGKKGENGSIGTPATRDKIIETLIKRGYIVDNGKNLYSTQLGRDFYNLLPDDIKKPDMTALWWTIQEDIKAGNATPEDMTRSVLDTFKAHLQTDYSSAQIGRQAMEREEIGTCPICGKPVYESKASFGCSGYKDGCKFALWKDNKFFAAFGKSITKTQAKALLGAKRRCLVSGIKKKDGSGTYDAYFVMTIKNGYPSFEMEFPSKKPVHKR